MDLTKLTDSEIAMFLAGHIENPCTCEVNGVTHNIRNFYLNLAERTLPSLTNPHASEFLRETMARYQTSFNNLISS